ncbi:MAG TPA: hypothetical protein VHD34_11055 [Xanthobacteraceae bacterium]|nr:hypothetical protein [Xanthobacteraceae bacterium]
MRYVLMLATIAALSLMAAPSFASRASADACAAKLSPEGKQIYAASIGSVGSGANMKDVVRSKTRALVIGGKISRGAARPAAEAAGACLKQAM